MPSRESSQNGKEKRARTQKRRGPLSAIRRWHHHNDDNDDEHSHYFMSEPSLSEAESTEYRPRAHGQIRSLLGTDESGNDDEEDDQGEDVLVSPKPPSPPPSTAQQNHAAAGAAAAAATAYPSSPGTSLSSWDSPHLFRKQHVQLYFSPEKSKLESISMPSSVALESSSRAISNRSPLHQPQLPNSNNNKDHPTANNSTSSSSTKMRHQSSEFLLDLKRKSVGAVKDARPEDFDSDSNVVNGADRAKVNAVIRNRGSLHGLMTGTSNVNVNRVESTDPDETLVMDLSASEDENEEKVHDTTKDTTFDSLEPLDWEAKHSADDEKTTERPRRRRVQNVPGHRRTRSGDAVAASLMTGGTDWKGMQIHKLPIPSEQSEHDESENGDSEEHRGEVPAAPCGQESANNRIDSSELAATETNGAFEIGTAVPESTGRAFKRPRRNQRIRRPPPPFSMERRATSESTLGSQRIQRPQPIRNASDSALQPASHERMSRHMFSHYALETPGSVVPAYVHRASPESMSTIEHYHSERMESDSSGHGGSVPRRQTRQRAFSLGHGHDLYCEQRADARAQSREQRRSISHSGGGFFQPSLDERYSDVTGSSFFLSSGQGGSVPRRQTRQRAISLGHGHDPYRDQRAEARAQSREQRRSNSLSGGGFFQPSLDERYSDVTGSSFFLPPTRNASFSPSQSRQTMNPMTDGFFHVGHEHRGDALYQYDQEQLKPRDESGSDFTGSEYGTDEDERERPVFQNRLDYGPRTLDEAERLLEDNNFRGNDQHMIRHAPLFETKKAASPASVWANFTPTTRNDGDFPTFVCPNCKTCQREFFTASSAPSQYQGPAGYLAFYFAVYVISSLFIFGLKEGWKPLDCVYFAVITLTTAGLGDFVPTTDGAKILCSIFIYFGVACIGLLLGSYLASMLDESSRKEAQNNRVQNCANCARLKNIKKIQQRRLKASQTTRRTTPQISIEMAKKFVSDRDPHSAGHSGPHIAELRAKKSHHQHYHQAKSPGSEPSARKPFDVGSASPKGANYQNDNGPTKGGVNESTECEGVKEDRDVIDSFSKPAITMSPPEPPGKGQGSPDNTCGSPMTAQILGRQSHTRHMSFDISSMDVPASSAAKRKSTERQRRMTTDMPRTTLTDPIPEDTPYNEASSQSWTGRNRAEEIESEDDSEDEMSTSSDSMSSTESELPFDKTARRLKTAKYVFLTLKKALMNSIAIIAVGGLGFFTIEKMTVVDSFYFTTVLLTTVGYGDITPVTSAGKLFATVYVLVAGTILLHNMSLISFIPLELRKRRIEEAVLTQFGDQLDDATLRELATGPLVQKLQLSSHSTSGLEECTREMFALAMLVRLGKVTETDIKQTFAAFRVLDVDNDGFLSSKSIIAGMLQKRRQSTRNAPQPPPPLVTEPAKSRSMYWFSRAGSLHVRADGSDYHFGDAEQQPHTPYESERTSLMENNTGYDSFGDPVVFAPAVAPPPEVELGYNGVLDNEVTCNESIRSV